jgi:tripartite-type tricarboxylate transporter receptor subunit TctC
MAWPYAAPPGLPQDRARALQNAFAAAHRDARFLAEAKTIGIDASPVNAEELRRSISDLSQAPAEMFDYVRRLLATGKGI